MSRTLKGLVIVIFIMGFAFTTSAQEAPTLTATGAEGEVHLEWTSVSTRVGSGSLTIEGQKSVLPEISEKPENYIQYDPSDYPAPRQGGDTIEEATVIDALPYNNTGTTAGYNDDYDEECPYTGSTSPDVVYSYAPTVDMLIDISICESAYDTKLYVYENDAGNNIACNDDECSDSQGNPYRSLLEQVLLTAGNTYYIVVDGYGGNFGEYNINVTQFYLETFNIYRDSDLFMSGVVGNSYVDADVVVGTEYCYTVTQIMPDDTESGHSNEACAIPEEGIPGDICPPTDLSAVGGNGTVDLSWTAPEGLYGGNNDVCEEAQPISSPYPVEVTGTSAEATADCPDLLNWLAVWYELELPYASNNVDIVVQADGPITNAGIILMDDCACDDYIPMSFDWDGSIGYLHLFSSTPISGPDNDGTILFPLFLDPPQGFTVTFNVTETVVAKSMVQTGGSATISDYQNGISESPVFSNEDDLNLPDYRIPENTENNTVNSRECGEFIEYVIYQDGVQIATSTSTNYSVTGLENETEFCFTVTASYVEGESSTTNEACATPSSYCPPSNLVAGGGDGEVYLVWTEPEFEGGGDEWMPLADLSANADWEASNVDLSSYAGSIIQLAFHHYDGGAWADGAGVDDIVISADGSELVSVNFDDGQLPDGWSIETPGVGWEFADANYFNTNADNFITFPEHGVFAGNDDDGNGSSNSADDYLITPTLDLSGYSSIALDLVYWHSGQYGGVTTVEVKVVEASDCGTFSHYAISRDGSEIGTSTSSMYTDTDVTNDTEYCYTVSAVYVEGVSSSTNEACATPAEMYIATLPISEDFEGALGEGWGQEVSDGAPTEWQFSSSAGDPPIPENGTIFAWIHDDDVGSGTPGYIATLHTPMFSTADGGIILLSFDYAFNQLGDFFDVVYRLPGGDWQLLSTLSSVLSWTPMSIDVTDEMGGFGAVQIGFMYNDASSWAWWVALDNVAVGSMTEVSLTGNVSSSLTGGPLEGAEVSADEADFGFSYVTTTDANGDYDITGLSGTYTITARADGHQTDMEEGVDASNGAVVDFVLEPALPGVAGLSAADAGNKSIQLDWMESGSVSEYELYYHDDDYEAQLGCGGGCWLGTKMTPPAYPATLVGAFMAFQGDAGTTAGNVQVYLDPSGSGDPYNNAELVWESDFFAAPPGEYYIEVPDIEIQSGDFYLMHNEQNSGFSGIALDESGGYPDRMFYANVDGWYSIADAGFPSNYFQTAYMVGTPPGIQGPALAERSSTNIRIATPQRYKQMLNAVDITIQNKSQIVEVNADLNPAFVLDGIDEYFTDPETWVDYGSTSSLNRDSTITALEIYRDDAFIASIDGDELSYLDDDPDLVYDQEYCYYVRTQWYISEYDATVYGSNSNEACAIPRLLGDVNGDGYITVEDIVMVIDFILEEATPNELEAMMADVNVDGEINILDVVIMVDYILGRAAGNSRVAAANGEALFEIITTSFANSHPSLDVALTYDGDMAGAQFTLRYDENRIALGDPVLTSAGANVFAKETAPGEMTVLVINLSGDYLELTEGSFVSFPVEMVEERSTGQLQFDFESAVASGPFGQYIPASSRSASIDLNAVPETYALHQNFPNPFNPTTSIRFDLKDAGSVDIVVYNLLGQKVKTLVNSELTTGYHEVVWDGTDNQGAPVGAGVYIYSLSSEHFSQTRKMILLK